jgi:phosphoserine phosphatase RsbU/P
VPSQEISEVIFRYAGRIAGERDKDALLALLADLARDLTGADRCSLWLTDRASQELWTKVAHGVKDLRIPIGQGLAGACVASGETVLVNDALSDARFAGRVDEKSGYRTLSVLAVPMKNAAGEVLGCCQLLNKPGGFSPDDVALAGLAASYSAGVLETQEALRRAEAARRLEREMEIARDVQRNLLPASAPSVKGLDLAVFFQPASHVGGDYYNHWVDGDKLFVTVGDVSGKGIAAALLMASIQAALGQATGSLAQRASNLSRFVKEHTAPGRYSTLIIAEYNMASGEVQYVNAGHVPPMLARADGTLERLEAGGPPIGLLPVSVYEEGSTDLRPGDTLALVTDGITESMNSQDVEFGSEGAERSLRAAASAAVMAQQMSEDALAFAGEMGQQDDITVLVLRRL